jgi:ubiquinone/menaquinone biosynthesis C-methylase UbiE
MLAHARGKRLPNVEFRVGDFHDLSSLDDGSADVITQFAASRYLTDPGRHHCEVARVLNADGVFITSYFEALGRRDEMLAAAAGAGLKVVGERHIPLSLSWPIGRVLGYTDRSIWLLSKR